MTRVRRLWPASGSARVGRRSGARSLVSRPLLAGIAIACLAAARVTLAVPVEVVAYPFGGPGEYDDRVMRTAARSGYRLAASYINGRNSFSSLAAHELRRLHVERYTDLATLASMLQLPQLFAGAQR